MTVRERAATDAKKILENSGGASTKATIHFKNQSVTVYGDISDIDQLLEKKEGMIQAREAYFSYSASAIPALPEKGYKVDFVELSGRPLTLYVSRVECDRTIGICRLALSEEPEPEYRD